MKLKRFIFMIATLSALLICALLVSCKKKEEPQPILYKSGYAHQVLITGSATSNAGQPDEDNIIWILNNSGADINLKNYTIEEKNNSWTITGDDIIIKTTEQYSQHTPSINQSYDEFKLYENGNLIFTYNQ